MKLAFFSCYLNHHQAIIADELYEMTNHSFVFVATTPIPAYRLRLGYSDYSDRPYLLKAYTSEEAMRSALEISKNSEVVLFGSDSFRFQIERMKVGKLSFEVSERWLKRGLINLLSPRLLINMWYYHTLFYKKPIYKLCSSAYCANDQYLLHSFINRCFKWGYFTRIDEFDIDRSLESSSSEIISIMWCSRFLSWKHPELPIELACRLKRDGYLFKIDMYGVGNELERSMQLCERLGVTDVVFFHGSKPNNDILHELRAHEIFLFTSDKNEGWGAVLNEAMSNGCAVVASDKIGSVPYLIRDGINGCIFKSGSLDSLYDKTATLLEDTKHRRTIAKQAYYDMVNLWSPKVAAKNLLQLIEDIQGGCESSIKEGPCSKAVPFSYKYKTN